MALVVTAAAVLVAAAGAYPWAAPPLAAISALLFLWSRAEPLRDRETRALDASLIAAIAIVGFQLVPLPTGALSAISSATVPLQDTIALEPYGAWRPLSVLAAKTRISILLAISGVLIFWSARAALARGGTRTTIRGLAFVGTILAASAIALQVVAPPGVLWDPLRTNVYTRPWGPFIDRNHLATWLVMALPLVTSLWLVTATDPAFSALPARIRILRALLNNRTVGLVIAIGLMLTALIATLSRSGAVALLSAVVCAGLMARGPKRARLGLAAVAMALLAAVALWLNADGIARRVEQTFDSRPGSVSRPTIWRETLRIVRDFPVAGTGAGTFPDTMLQYQTRNQEALFNHAHDEPLQLLAEGGVLLLGAVMVALGFFVHQLRRLLREDGGSSRQLRIGAAASVAAVAVQSIWEIGLHMPANLVLLAIAAALALRPARGGSMETQ